MPYSIFEILFDLEIEKKESFFKKVILFVLGRLSIDMFS
jgi:hypothetical protein